MLGWEDWALAVGGGRIRGTGSNSSGMWRERLEELEELQREEDRRGSRPGTTDGSVNQEHLTVFRVETGA